MFPFGASLDEEIFNQFTTHITIIIIKYFSKYFNSRALHHTTIKLNNKSSQKVSNT